MTNCWLGATPSNRTIMVRPTCPVREHSRLEGRVFLRTVKLEWRLVISASSFRPLKVASSLVRWILATASTTSRVLSPRSGQINFLRTFYITFIEMSCQTIKQPHTRVYVFWILCIQLKGSWDSSEKSKHNIILRYFHDKQVIGHPN